MYFNFRYVDKETGRNFLILDVGFDFFSLFEKQRRFISKKINNFRNWIIKKKNGFYTGTYIWRNGMWVLTGKGNALDVWFAKYKLYPDQGLREKHNFYISQLEKGKDLHGEDRDCIERSIKRYGRYRADTGYYNSKVHRDAKR